MQHCRLFDCRVNIEQNGEFITAQASHAVSAPNTVEQSLGNILEKHVAYVMTERVIDDLEVIEINKKHRQHMIFGVVTGQWCAAAGL